MVFRLCSPGVCHKLFPFLCHNKIRWINQDDPLHLFTGLQTRLSPPQLAVFSYVLLKMMWLKFLIIWRFFRLWALADGVNPPENMLRCMSNNCSLSDFWKGWHSSFNLWIVRSSDSDSSPLTSLSSDTCMCHWAERQIKFGMCGRSFHLLRFGTILSRNSLLGVVSILCSTFLR